MQKGLCPLHLCAAILPKSHHLATLAKPDGIKRTDGTGGIQTPTVKMEWLPICAIANHQI
jgi:hypothetical protein